MAHVQEVRLDPNPLQIGKPVTVTLVVDDPEAIDVAKVYDPRGYELRFQRNGDVFELKETVPFDAEPGTYYATLVVYDKEGNVERKSIDLRIG